MILDCWISDSYPTNHKVVYPCDIFQALKIGYTINPMQSEILSFGVMFLKTEKDPQLALEQLR
jgi:hypothetical protein